MNRAEEPSETLPEPYEGPWVLWARTAMVLCVPYEVDGLVKPEAPQFDPYDHPLSRRQKKGKVDFPETPGGNQLRTIHLAKGPNVLAARASCWNYREENTHDTRFVKSDRRSLVGVKHDVPAIRALIDETTGQPLVEQQEAALLRIVRWLAEGGHRYSLRDYFTRRPGETVARLTLCPLALTTKEISDGSLRDMFTFAQDRDSCGVVHDWAMTRGHWSIVDAARRRGERWFGGPQ